MFFNEKEHVNKKPIEITSKYFSTKQIFLKKAKLVQGGDRENKTHQTVRRGNPERPGSIVTDTLKN